MGERTKIEWADHTANPWRIKDETIYPNVLFRDRCKSWNRKAKKAGKVHTVAIEDCDFFDDHQTAEVYRLADFQTIDECPNLLFLLLTKRPGNVPKMWPPTSRPPQALIDEVYEGRDGGKFARHRPNVALVASISDQQSADELIPDLLKCRGLVKCLGVSAEPLVGPVDFRKNLQYENERWFCSKCGWRGMPPDCCWRESVGCYICPKCPGFVYMGSTEFPCLDFAIIGGESGPHARPMHPDWARSIRDQCVAAKVPFFFKQWGEWCPIDEATLGLVGNHEMDLWPGEVGDPRTLPTLMLQVGKKAAGRLLDGKEWNQLPWRKDTCQTS